MASHPGEYQWSSYQANAQGESSGLVQPTCYTINLQKKHPVQSAYRELYRHTLDQGFVNQIRQATIGNLVLGNDRFVEEIGKLLNRRVTPENAGRPVK